MALLARALCALAVVFCSFAATAQTHNEFPALAYQEVAGYVKGASTPGDACATYASIFGWNKNNYTAQLEQQQPGYWKCQRYYKGSIDPSWYTFITGQCQVNATPLAWLTGRQVSYPEWDKSRGVCYCTAPHVFNGDIQWCELLANPNEIALSGASRTKALVAGPAIVQVASVTNHGAPVSGVAVSIAISNGSSVSGTTDANGQFAFTYDASNRLSRVEAIKGSDAVFVQYLHNALGQRVFKSDPQVLSTTGISGSFDAGFIGWIRRNFDWLLAPWHGGASPGGLAFVYDEQGSMLAAYSNGSNHSARHQIEYIWLPLEDGTSIPIGAYNGGRFYAVHTDHLGTPRLITGANSTPAWQWPYSAFGGNKPTGVLKTVTTTTTTSAGTTTSVQLKATPPALESNLRFRGQYWDSESYLYQNHFRMYCPGCGRYTQFDPDRLRDGTNGFLYAHANAINLDDPSGLFVGADDLLITGTVLAVGCVINSACAGAAADAAATVVQRLVDQCTEDPCRQIYADIDRLVNQLERRYRQLRENKGNLPLTGPASIEGHRTKYRNRQSELRDKLNEANARGCLAYRQDAWAWATGKPPYPSGQ